MTTFFFSDKSTVYCIYHVYVSMLYLCDGFMFMFRLYSAAFHCSYVSFCSLTMLRVHWSVLMENFDNCLWQLSSSVTSRLFIVYIMFMCGCYIYVMVLCLCLGYIQPHSTVFMCPFAAWQCCECTGQLWLKISSFLFLFRWWLYVYVTIGFAYIYVTFQRISLFLCFLFQYDTCENFVVHVDN